MKKTVVMSLLLAMSISLPGFAQETAQKAPAKKDKAPAISAEQRQQMAAVHQQMADCLKSDKPMSECHDQMRKSCSGMMGKEGCGMMGMEMHGGMMGKGRGRMMQQQPSESGK